MNPRSRRSRNSPVVASSVSPDRSPRTTIATSDDRASSTASAMLGVGSVVDPGARARGGRPRRPAGRRSRRGSSGARPARRPATISSVSGKPKALSRCGASRAASRCGAGGRSRRAARGRWPRSGRSPRRARGPVGAAGPRRSRPAPASDRASSPATRVSSAASSASVGDRRRLRRTGARTGRAGTSCAGRATTVASSRASSIRPSARARSSGSP